MNKPNVRYSFANAKQLHIDIYKTYILDRLAAGDVSPAEEISSRALFVADTAVETLQNEGRIHAAD